MRLKLHSILLLLVLLLSFVATVFAEQNTNPGINRSYQNPDPEEWREVFERDGREIWDRREDILKALKLAPGDRVADVGTGTGFFALMFARKVGEKGKVYAVDIAESFVEGVKERASEEQLRNIIGVVNNQKSVNLPASSVDLVFISDTYHHFEYPLTTLQSIYTALDSEGEMVIIDFRKVKGLSSRWVMSHVRGNKQAVIEEVESQGFKLIEDQDFMQSQFYLRFRKPGKS